jgi:putative FmdB family regulatory protein
MPIYEYACKKCEHGFDALQKMSDPVLVDCPECGEASLRKLMSAPKFRLKGKGWYETDFKTGEKRNNLAGNSDPGDKKKDATSKESKSDGADKSSQKTEVKKTSTETKVASE